MTGSGDAHLAAQGLLLREATVLDATIISAPRSTKNDSGMGDPEMHPTEKGKHWFFGREAHKGAELSAGLVHTVVGTAANVNDVTVGNRLLHAQQADVFATPATRGRTSATTPRTRPGTWR